ncbi:MAG: peptide ABC transporter substrate-binding protein [Pyrinomonadaceae bacterium MAG19_C2-C3]|nr:peptide ABC transporter substrate-binding protein [Pyrinomonadaceae bacterium MAG19_C2-C3]
MATINQRQTIKLCTLIIVSMMATACASAGAEDKYFGKIAPPKGQVLRYITGAEPETIDPHTMTGQPESRIAAALFDGLVEYDEKGVNPIPSLAQRWQPNENGTIWTFYLRRDARWTDGTPLNAHDVVYSWRRGASPELAATYANFMYVVKNGQAYNAQSAFVRDAATGKYATESDLERAGKDGAVNFTGDVPVRFDQPNETQTQAPIQAAAQTTTQTKSEKYLFVPADESLRAKLLAGDAAKKTPAKPELARFTEGKEFVPVTKEYVGVKALDDYTLQVTLEGPTAYFTKMILHQFFRPVPRQAIEKHGDKLWIKPGNIVSSGGFRMVSWNPYDKIIVERNPFHWDAENTLLDRIVFPSVEELTTAMNLYKSGEVDATQSNEVPVPWRNQLFKTKKDYVAGPALYVEFLAIKTTMPPFNDARVRRALSLAIDRRVLADRAPGQLGAISMSPPMDGYDPPQGTDFKPDEARRLLAEAGFPDGKGFPEFEIVYNTNENNKALYEIVQAMLKRELGIKVELTNQEFRTYLVNTRASALNYKGLSRHGWVADYADPNAFLELLLSTSENNHTGWKDPKYDAMLLAANAETNLPLRIEKLRQADAYAMREQPMIPLTVKPLAWVRKPYVRGMNANVLDQHNWRRVSIDHDWQASLKASDSAAQSKK